MLVSVSMGLEIKRAMGKAKTKVTRIDPINME